METTRRPTMPDVARLAGVSLKTVSRVVNGAPHVRPETEERVRAAVASLGFRPNQIASSLRSGQTSASIGLVIEDLANPFYSTIARAVEAVAAPRFMVVAASSEENPEREVELVASLCTRRVDGLLIVPAGGDHRYLASELEMGTPMVFLDRPPVGVKVDAVVLDNRRGATNAAAHLAERGHTRIALVADSTSIYTMNERLRGYRAGLRGAGLPDDPSLIRLDCHRPAEAEAATDDLLDAPRPPTAIFAANNRSTMGVLRSVWRRGADVEVVGFDDFELADLMPVPFTVVAHDPAAMGRTAAELLLRRIDGEEGAAERIVLPTTLVARGTDVRSSLSVPTRR